MQEHENQVPWPKIQVTHTDASCAPESGRKESAPIESYYLLKGTPILSLVVQLMRLHESQDLHLIGPAGAGKTTLCALLIAFIHDHYGDDEALVTAITFEECTKWCQTHRDPKTGEFFVKPRHGSGTYTASDYEIITNVYELMHEQALADARYKLIVGETVSLTGVKLAGETEGKQRGTQAILNLVEAGYPVSAIALAGGQAMYAHAMNERSKKPSDGDENRPGGSPLGTWWIDENIREVLASVFAHWADLYDNREIRMEHLEEFYLPWLLHEYFGLRTENYSIARNVYAPERHRSTNALTSSREQELLKHHSYLSKFSDTDHERIAHEVCSDSPQS